MTVFMVVLCIEVKRKGMVIFMKEIYTDELLELITELTAEKDINILIKKIINSAVNLANCDGGSLYILNDDKLEFKARITKSLNVFNDDINNKDILPPVELKHSNICAYSVMKRTSVNIPDAYKSDIFDFSGPMEYDEMLGYKTVSVIVSPLINSDNDIIGALQLVNAFNANGEIIPFDTECESMLRALASLAASCLTKMNYVNYMENVLEYAFQLENVKQEMEQKFNLANAIINKGKDKKESNF